MTLEEIYLPLWAQYCLPKNRLLFSESEDGSLLIEECKDKRECYGCDPTGCKLPINPLKLKLVEEFCSMSFNREECPDIYMSDELLAKRLGKYKNSKEKFYFWRGISSDLDTVRVFKCR